MRPLVERPVPGLAVRPSTAPSDGASTGAQFGWSELARASGNVFATPEFADASVAQLPDGADVHIRTVVDGDRPVAVVPLVLQRVGGLRIARLLGAPVADDLSPACAPEDRARAADEIRTAVAELGADVLFAERLPAEQGWAELLGGHELASDASPVIPIGGIEWSAYLGSRSSNFRQQVRRRTRALEGLGATYRLSDAASLDHDLETLFSLHRARWGGESTTFTECEPFHRAFAPVALSRGWLRLWLLEVDDEPVAATYGFRFGSSESYYQSGRSPKWNKMSPGLVLLAHAVRSAMEDGMAEFRLLRGNESHKGRFTDQGLTLVSLGVGLTALGRVAVAAAPHLPRRWLRRFA